MSDDSSSSDDELNGHNFIHLEPDYSNTSGDELESLSNDSDESDFIETKKLKSSDKSDLPNTENTHNVSVNDDETCVICFEPWTLLGDHKLVSLKCGHFFGKHCIDHWLKTNGRSAKCPLCQTPCLKNDIRSHYINIHSIKMVDNTEFLQCKDKCSKLEKHLKQYEMDISNLKLKNSLLSLENDKLQNEIKLYREKCDQMIYQNGKWIGGTSDLSSNRPNFMFELQAKLVISNTGNCRVIDYSDIHNCVATSCPTGNALFSGYGVKIINLHHNKIIKNIRSHDQCIRDLKFDPHVTSNLLLTGGLDSAVKLSCPTSNAIVCTWACRAPVWSVSWSSNPHLFYAGLNNGEVCELDSRRPSEPLRYIWKQPGGPIHSLNYTTNNEHTVNSGLFVSNASGNIFIPDKSIQNLSSQEGEGDGVLELMDFLNNIATPISEEQTNKDISTLQLSSHYQGTISHTAYNEKTGHLLSTIRTTGNDSRLKFQVSEIGRNREFQNNIYSVDVKSFIGGRSMKFMSKSSFLSFDNDELYALCPDEESASVNLFDVKSLDPVYKFHHKEINPRKPILDVCQVGKSTPLSFAALSAENFYLLRSH